MTKLQPLAPSVVIPRLDDLIQERERRTHGRGDVGESPHFKTCDWCYREKPLSDYHRNRASKDGRTSKCKLCCGIYRREVKRIMDASIRAARAIRGN